METAKTTLDGVLTIQPSVFEDHRGTYTETYNERLYRQHGINAKFVQDDISTSSQHVLRGLHGDDFTSKLISCYVGRFYLLVVNNDASSPQYKQWEGFTLSESNRMQVFIPPKFGNGHLVMSPWAMFHYKQSSEFTHGEQFTIRWNDPEWGFWWPINNPILSKRDQKGGY